MPKKRRPPVDCPHCGATFRAGRPACPECGSDDATGWREQDDLDYLSVEIPDGLGSEFDPPQRGRQTLWIVAALLALAGMLVLTLFRG